MCGSVYGYHAPKRSSLDLKALTLLAKDLSRSTSLSQDLETGCLRLEVVKILGVQISKGDHNIRIFQP